MFYFVIPCYNSFNRLCLSLKSIISLSFEIDHKIHIFDNGSTDFDWKVWAEFEQYGVILHRFEDTVDMPINWNRCTRFLRQRSDLMGWYMLHVGDEVTMDFPVAYANAKNLLYSSRKMFICNSNLRKISPNIDLLQRANFPNITQIIFMGNDSPFLFSENNFPIFDLLTFAPLFESYEVSYINLQIVQRSDGIDDLGTKVRWYPSAFKSLFTSLRMNINFRSKIHLFFHLIKLGIGDFLRKNLN